MKALFHARSPFWQILFATQVFAVLVGVSYAVTTDASGNFINGTFTVPAYVGLLSVIGFPLSALIASYVVRKYNASHPKTKMRLLQSYPPELIENDERLKAITAQATRNTYIYFNIALPLLPFIVLILQPKPYSMIALLGVVRLGHYIVYWIGIAPALEDD